MPRIQFELSDSDMKRMSNYIPDFKYRHVFAHKALTEWITRQEGRDKRFKRENMRQNAKALQEIFDSGMVNFPDKKD